MVRIPKPCTEDFAAMAPTERGAFCESCQDHVLDLRRIPRKRALLLLEERRRESPSGRVCARVKVRDGAPVFAPEPPGFFARVAGPIAMAASLAACAQGPELSARGTTPATPGHAALPLEAPSAARTAPPNQNPASAPVTTPVSATSVAPCTPPAVNGQTGVIDGEMMGDVAFGP